MTLPEAFAPAHARSVSHLLVMDVDSTLTTTEGIDLLAELAGVGEQVADITAAAMRGELDFEQSLRRRVALLAGLPAAAIVEASAQVGLTPGAERLIDVLRRTGWRVGVVSGGFTDMVAPLAMSLALDHMRANVLDVVDGRLTGRLVGPVEDRAAKAAALRDWAAEDAVPLEATVAIGDGANDLDMLAEAGLGIAFHAKPAVAAAADARITEGGLDAALTIIREWLAARQ
jgi:phosphoserine phosphatase